LPIEHSSPRLRVCRRRRITGGLGLDLLNACVVAFVAVFVLLTFLAGVMHAITLLFPERKSALDPTLVAAITGTVAAMVPGARVTRIEEES